MRLTAGETGRGRDEVDNDFLQHLNILQLLQFYLDPEQRH